MQNRHYSIHEPKAQGHVITTIKNQHHLKNRLLDVLALEIDRIISLVKYQIRLISCHL